MILVSGGSGHLATLVAREARVRGLDLTVGSRNPASVRGPVRHVDFDAPETLDFRDVETLLLISAGTAEDDVVMVRHENAIAAAERAKVRHVVYTSLVGSGDHLAFALAHRWTERRLKNSNLEWTVLRNGLYAELVGILAAPTDGVITSPFGQGTISCVARDDLADAAVAVLSNPALHAGRVYELCGTETWTMDDLAEQLGVIYRPVTLNEKREDLNRLPLLPFQPAMLMSIFSAASAGFLRSVATDLPALLSTSPRETLAIAAKAATT